MACTIHGSWSAWNATAWLRRCVLVVPRRQLTTCVVWRRVTAPAAQASHAHEWALLPAADATLAQLTVATAIRWREWVDRRACLCRDWRELWTDRERRACVVDTTRQTKTTDRIRAEVQPNPAAARALPACIAACAAAASCPIFPPRPMDGLLDRRTSSNNASMFGSASSVPSNWVEGKVRRNTSSGAAPALQQYLQRLTCSRTAFLAAIPASLTANLSSYSVSVYKTHLSVEHGTCQCRHRKPLRRGTYCTSNGCNGESDKSVDTGAANAQYSEQTARSQS